MRLKFVRKNLLGFLVFILSIQSTSIFANWHHGQGNGFSTFAEDVQNYRDAMGTRAEPVTVVTVATTTAEAVGSALTEGGVAPSLAQSVILGAGVGSIAIFPKGPDATPMNLNSRFHYHYPGESYMHPQPNNLVCLAVNGSNPDSQSAPLPSPQLKPDPYLDKVAEGLAEGKDGYMVVFRGVSHVHSQFADAQAGVATPRLWPGYGCFSATPALKQQKAVAHTCGSTEGSCYTSWSKSPVTAYAKAMEHGSGVVLIDLVREDQITPTPAPYDANFRSEYQVLRWGQVSALYVLPTQSFDYLRRKWGTEGDIQFRNQEF